MTIFIIARQISKQSTSLNLEATSNLQKKDPELETEIPSTHRKRSTPQTKNETLSTAVN